MDSICCNSRISRTQLRGLGFGFKISQHCFNSEKYTRIPCSQDQKTGASERNTSAHEGKLTNLTSSFISSLIQGLPWFLSGFISLRKLPGHSLLQVLPPAPGEFTGNILGLHPLGTFAAATTTGVPLAPDVCRRRRSALSQCDCFRRGVSVRVTEGSGSQSSQPLLTWHLSTKQRMQLLAPRHALSPLPHSPPPYNLCPPLCA